VHLLRQVLDLEIRHVMTLACFWHAQSRLPAASQK
jgi:hypothetical protein